MPRKKKQRKPTQAELPQIVDELLQIMGKLCKRMDKLEKADRIARPIGFYTDCQSSTEVHQYIEDDSEVPEMPWESS